MGLNPIAQIAHNILFHFLFSWMGHSCVKILNKTSYIDQCPSVGSRSSYGAFALNARSASVVAKVNLPHIIVVPVTNGPSVDNSVT